MSWENLSFEVSIISDLNRDVQPGAERGFQYQIQEDEQFNHLCSQYKHSHEMCSYCKADRCLCFRISIKQIFSNCTPACTPLFY